MAHASLTPTRMSATCPGVPVVLALDLGIGTDAAHVYGATLTAWAETSGVAYQGIPIATIKRHANGKGNANKVGMMVAARAHGFSPADGNEADAIAILLTEPGGSS